MKKNNWIMTLITLIIVSIVFVSCGQTLSGTFSFDYDTDFTINFKGNKFDGIYDGRNVSGTFTIKDGRITLKMQNDTWTWIKIDDNTLRDVTVKTTASTIRVKSKVNSRKI